MNVVFRLLIIPVLFLSACASKPLTSVDRTRFGKTAIFPTVQCPTDYSYVDLTAKRARASGAGFGLVGALIGEAVASSSISGGRARFDGVVRQMPVDVRGEVQKLFTQTLESTKLFQIVPSGTTEAATFHMSILSYGLQPADDSKLGGTIVLKTELVDGAQQVIWSKRTIGTSSVAALLDDYVKNPSLWKMAIQEAAADVTRKTILYAD